MTQVPSIMSLREAEVDVCPPGTQLVYPSINSCLTVTATFRDGTRTGAHLVLVNENHPWRQVLNQWLTLTEDVIHRRGVKPTHVVIAGAEGCWEKSDLDLIERSINQKLGVQSVKMDHMEGDLRVLDNGTVERQH